MNLDEIAILSRMFSNLGITKLKLTGGEPLVRTDLEEIIRACRPYFKEISLTTNGHELSSRLENLKRSGLDRLNISLDSLNPKRYKKITGSNGVKSVEKVIEGIKIANKFELFPIKVNMVVMKGINDDEIFDMAVFCATNNSILQIIELETDRENEKNRRDESNFYNIYNKYHVDLRPIEYELSTLAYFVVTRRFQNRKKYVIPIKRILPRCKRKFEKYNIENIEKNIDKLNAEIEVVRSMHNTLFCAKCSRVRITSDGYLKPCLLSQNGHLDLLSLINKSDEKKAMETIREAIMNREPYWR